MKVFIHCDEKFPFYTLFENPLYDECDLPDELVERWKRVHAEFEEVQDLLDKAYESHKMSQYSIGPARFPNEFISIVGKAISDNCGLEKSTARIDWKIR